MASRKRIRRVSLDNLMSDVHRPSKQQRVFDSIEHPQKGTIKYTPSTVFSVVSLSASSGILASLSAPSAPCDNQAPNNSHDVKLAPPPCCTSHLSEVAAIKTNRTYVISPQQSVLDLPTMDGALAVKETPSFLQLLTPSTLDNDSQSIFKDDIKRDPSSAIATEKFSLICYMLFALYLLVFACDVRRIYTVPSHSNDCIYVPGGGFSGFWFTLGRLQSIPLHQRIEKDYYCYSAGCLAVVATSLLDKNKEEMYDIAVRVQKAWQTGQVERYSVVKVFLDELLFGTSVVNGSSPTIPVIDDAALSKINIITTARTGRLSLKTVVRIPSSVADLHQMLLQTTWIPYATGDGVWKNEHMDGAFTALLDHPSCGHHVGLAMNPWLVANIVNVNLPTTDVERFWNLGLEYGIN